ncbi:MAG TPA: hypothetical protein PLI01_00440 [Nitrospira sp.]|nr:hypothetical protein [Nitrospira sp.]HNA25227.1 hypothetical protein [Nitrospira sp.]HNI17517.1 hypothetical protein [Nitrospira sp.]
MSEELKGKLEEAIGGGPEPKQVDLGLLLEAMIEKGGGQIVLAKNGNLFAVCVVSLPFTGELSKQTEPAPAV